VGSEEYVSIDRRGKTKRNFYGAYLKRTPRMASPLMALVQRGDSNLIPNHARKEPAALAELEIIAIVFCNFGRYTLAGPITILYRSLRY